MAYTALAKMRNKNLNQYGVDVGPMEPGLFTNTNRDDYESSALRFIHESCEGLKFNPDIEAEEEKTGVYQGTSIKPNQIPFNMQMDINRLCLERCLEQFLVSGVADDAYLVYYCYWEIFFGNYSESKNMIELLSEYETNGSSLLMKHRDHYSHSVYVFALGLAVYETNEHYREAFGQYIAGKYGKEYSDSELACLFLEYWGMTALFHDIGYPFELPFEQVMSYFEVDKQKRGKNNPYIAYHAMETLTGIDEEAAKHFKGLFGKEFSSIEDLLAFDLTTKMGAEYGFDEEYIRNVIASKPEHPNEFGYFMDHAVFSSIRLYRELDEAMDASRFTEMHVDALTAIVLHNSLYKFAIAFYDDPDKHKIPLKAGIHPLAWLLMLCDEFQCWDRTAYGRNSRTELHPMDADFDFSNNAITATYYYDKQEQDKIDQFAIKYAEWEAAGKQEKPPRLKAYSDMAGKEQRFTKSIEKIIDTSIIPLSVEPNTRVIDRKSKHTFLSDSNFLHLFDFAVALHGRNLGSDATEEQMLKKFESKSLEYRLSTINRAKNFSRYLEAIDCFYTDRPVDYEMVTEFNEEQAAVFAPLEHERWIREHQAMGWTHGNLYENVGKPDEARNLREQMRCHKLAMDGDITSEDIYQHYLALPVEEQDKDWKPFNVMLALLKKFDGIRIYSLN